MNNYYHITTGQFGYPQPKGKYESITYSSKDGCPTCWVGHKQINEFRFSGEPKPLKNSITGLNWVFDQIFVRQIVKSIFDKENLTGIDYSNPLFHKTEEQIPEFHQIRVDTILPPSLLNRDLPIEVCEYPKDEKMAKFLKANGSKLVEGPFCGQEKHNFPQGQTLIFKKDAFENAPDFVRTNEWFGSGGSANRAILVSEKVKDIIKRNMLKGAFFQQIELK